MRSALLLAVILSLAACGPSRRNAQSGGGGGGGAAGGGVQGGQGGDQGSDRGNDGEGGAEGDVVQEGGGEGAEGAEGGANDDGGDEGGGNEGAGEGGADEGGGDEGGGDGPFAFYDCSEVVFPDADIDDLIEDFSPARWRDAAVGVLDRRFPGGAWVANELDNPDDFDRWFRNTRSMSAVLEDLNTGIHEGVHMLGFQNFGMQYSFTLGEEEVVEVPRIELFFRSEVLDRLPQEARDGFYAETYLTGQMGGQGIETLLDEFNAYTFSLLVDIALFDQFSRNSKRSSRDGLITFMLFTEVYLHIARTEHPRDYDRLLNAPGFGELVLTLFDRAWCVYVLSGDDPRLEIEASRIVPHVLDEQWLSEVDRLREALRDD